MHKAMQTFGCRCGFNRYMVECEYVHKKESDEMRKVLIDTWWNVNVKPAYSPCANAPVLIDTWWNVNNIFLSIA